MKHNERLGDFNFVLRLNLATRLLLFYASLPASIASGFSRREASRKSSAPRGRGDDFEEKHTDPKNIASTVVATSSCSRVRAVRARSAVASRPSGGPPPHPRARFPTDANRVEQPRRCVTTTVYYIVNNWITTVRLHAATNSTWNAARAYVRDTLAPIHIYIYVYTYMRILIIVCVYSFDGGGVTFKWLPSPSTANAISLFVITVVVVTSELEVRVRDVIRYGYVPWRFTEISFCVFSLVRFWNTSKTTCENGHLFIFSSIVRILKCFRFYSIETSSSYNLMLRKKTIFFFFFVYLEKVNWKSSRGEVCGTRFKCTSTV